MKFIEKIIRKGFFSRGKEDGTIKLNNRLVQEDLYLFLNSDIRSISMTITKDDHHICRVIDDDNAMYYPYENKEEMEEDYLELRRLIKKLK